MDKLHLPSRLARNRAAFTLVELMVVIAIIGMLTAILFSAVQYSREASRRISCQNNLRQMGLALQCFHEARLQFPAGRDGLSHLDHSWVTRILPYMEQSPLYVRYDFQKPWYDGGPGRANQGVGETVLPSFRCPSSHKKYLGDTDYGGILGSSLSGLPLGDAPGQSSGSGILIATCPVQPDPVGLSHVSDGASTTILVAECVDRPTAAGRWAAGWNCLSHDNGPINSDWSNCIQSLHSGVAYVVMADGSTQSLTTAMELCVLGALCTRDASDLGP